MDQIDEKLIALLVRHARATYAELGDEVGLSAPATKRRVDRLVTEGTIAGFSAVVDPAALGWDTEAYVQVHCRGTIQPQILRRVWEPIPEIVSASTVSGSADAILRVRARDVRHLEQALERIRADEIVERTESIIVLSRLIERT